MSKPAPKKPTRTVTRTLSGFPIGSEAYTSITLYSDGGIRIERHWCSISRGKEWEVLEESDWTPHKHLVGSIEPRKVKPETSYKHPLDK